jgi:small subunit ribosomal protein S20
MPNHKSAEKRDRQNAKRNANNTAHRSRLRTAIKKLRAAIAAKDTEAAQSLLPQTVSAIDKSIQKGVLHRNAAARYKSNLTAHVNDLSAAK